MLYNHYLHVFIKTADCGSFSKAALDLYISPNAVIKQINNFENQLGITLFDRTNHGLRLTEEGKIIYKEGKKLIHRSDRLLQELRHSKNAGLQATVRIGSSFLFPSRNILQFWAMVQQDHPDIKVSNVPFVDTDAHYFDADNPFWESVDVILVIFDHSPEKKGLEMLRLRDRPLCVGVPFGHPLTKKDRLTFDDLNGETILIVEEGLSDYIDKARKGITEACPDVNIIDSAAYDMNTFNRCADNGYLMLAIRDWQEIHPSMQIIPVDWPYTLPYGIMYKRNPPKAVQTFISEIRRILEPE